MVEPRTEYTGDEVVELLADFRITSQEFNDNKDNIYILGTVL